MLFHCTLLFVALNHISSIISCKNNVSLQHIFVYLHLPTIPSHILSYNSISVCYVSFVISIDSFPPAFARFHSRVPECNCARKKTEKPSRRMRGFAYPACTYNDCILRVPNVQNPRNKATVSSPYLERKRCAGPLLVRPGSHRQPKRENHGQRWIITRDNCTRWR